MLKWWEVPQNCECLFALDSDSVITDDSIISPSNNTINYLVTKDAVKGKVFKSFASGFVSKNFNIVADTFYLYKTLRLNAINLVFNEKIPLTKQQTWFLMCKLNGNSVLSTGLSNSAHGLTYDITGTDTKYSRNWRVAGFVTGSDYDFDKRSNSSTLLHKVFVNVDMDSRELSIKTDYGIYTEPYDINTTFGSPYDLKVIGYEADYWYPKIDIIAYGLFDGILTEEELSLMVTAVDDNFLVSSKEVAFKNIIVNPSLNLEDVLSKLSFINLEINQSLKNVYPKESKPFTTNFKLFEHEIKTSAKLYKNLKNISDVVLEEGLPAKQVTVFLNERNSGILLKTTKSDEKGGFSFYNLSSDLEYTVTANDSKYQFGSIIKNYNR